MSRVRSILLLGGSRQQVIAIEKARELGFRTVVCDYLPDNPGQYVADSFYLVSTTDRNAILEVASNENVSGVLSYASDPAAPTAAYVTEVLGLPGNPLSSVVALSEKHLFRRLMGNAGLPVPRHISFFEGSNPSEIETLLEGFHWPVVVKPTDSSGSKGVSVIGDSTGLGAAIEEASSRSRNGILVAEEYIRSGYPHVVGGDIFVFDGEIRFWGLMDCLRDGSRGGLVPVGEIFPSALSIDVLDSVKMTLQQLVSFAGIRAGELNVEVIIDESGVPYVLELGARAGGNMIPLQLSDASGIDLVRANVLCAMGEDPGDISFDGDGVPCAHVVLHAEESGTFDHIVFPDELDCRSYRTVLYKEPGEHVSAFEDAGGAVGIAFFRFANRAEADVLLHNQLPRVVLR